MNYGDAFYSIHHSLLPSLFMYRLRMKDFIHTTNKMFIGMSSMKELFFFFWFSWFFVIIVVFFMEKGFEQRLFLLSLLGIMICKNLQVSIGHLISMSLSFILLLFCTLLYFAFLRLGLYHFFATYIVIFTYVGILLLYKVSPASFIVQPNVLIPIASVSITVFLHRTFPIQRATLMLGFVLGQLLFHLILRSYHLEVRLQDESFFILFYVSLLILLVIQGFIRSVSLIRRRLSSAGR